MLLKHSFSGLVLVIIAGSFVDVALAQSGNVGVLPGPSQPFSITEERLPTSVIVIWRPVDDAISYILRIYRGDKLQREIRNLVLTIRNVTGLDGGTNYSVTVAALFEDDEGNVLESIESSQKFFETPAECGGRRIYVPCTAHCVSTCEDPDPVCGRVCTSGCGCPRDLPIWYRGGCIPRVLCPPPTGAPIIPANVQAERAPNAQDIIVAWDIVENAANYTVQVRLADGSETVIQTVTTIAPIVSISDLEPDVVYVFLVTANLVPNYTESVARDAILPPSNIVVFDITNSSFRVQWSSQSEAVRHVFLLYDETQSILLYSNDKIAGTIINIESLIPGTTYYFSVASAENGTNPGITSRLQRVRTEGESADAEDYRAARVINVLEATTTPTIQPTIKTTTRSLTDCLEMYNSVQAFYDEFPRDDAGAGPKYPNCDDQGLYVTRYCDSVVNNICHCIGADDGEKVRGTDFGGTNSAFELDCDQVGTLDAEVTEFRAVNIRSSSLILMWNQVNGINGYVIVTDDGLDTETTKSVEGNIGVQMMVGLLSGQRYTFEIFAINSQGWSGPVSTIQVTTAFVDRPENLRITETTENSVTVTWDQSDNADEYEVILTTSSGENSTELTLSTFSNSVTFTDLSNDVTITVRAITVRIEVDGEVITYRSESISIEVTLQCQLPPLDLIYVLDSSANTGYRNLQQVKKLMQDITSIVPPLNPATGTRVAAAKYNARTRNSFTFTRLNRTRNAVLALSWLSYNGGRIRNVSRALNFIREYYFSPSASTGSNRIRPNALSVVIFFVVGEPDDLRKTEMEAALLRNLTNVIAVGVNEASDESLLSAIASRPDLTVLAPSFEELASVNKTIVSKFCSLL